MRRSFFVDWKPDMLVLGVGMLDIRMEILMYSLECSSGASGALLHHPRRNWASSIGVGSKVSWW